MLISAELVAAAQEIGDSGKDVNVGAVLDELEQGEPSQVYFSPASSRIAVSVARPLSVSAYAPISRLCAMNPRTAMDCIACARMPTAA
jgi:hypothetical protein